MKSCIRHWILLYYNVYNILHTGDAWIWFVFSTMISIVIIQFWNSVQLQCEWINLTATLSKRDTLFLLLILNRLLEVNRSAVVATPTNHQSENQLEDDPYNYPENEQSYGDSCHRSTRKAKPGCDVGQIVKASITCRRKVVLWAVVRAFGCIEGALASSCCWAVAFRTHKFSTVGAWKHIIIIVWTVTLRRDISDISAICAVVVVTRSVGAGCIIGCVLCTTVTGLRSDAGVVST